jgi:hypothetical protein
MRHALAALLATSLLLTACGGEGDEEGGPLMRPGEDCLGCHAFAAAGTVFHASGAGASGVTVTVTVGGAAHTLTTNSAGNFYLPSAGGSVSAASVAGTSMPAGNGISGRCNACHAGGLRLTVP